MLRLSKLSIIVLLLFVAGAVALAVRYFAQTDSPRTASPSGSVDALLEAIPADTAFVVVGHNTPEGLEEMQGWFDSGADELQMLYELLREETEHPLLPLLFWLGEDYVSVLERDGFEGIHQRYGIDPEGAYAYYLHGAIPVIRFSITDREKVLALLDEAEAQTGVSHQAVVMGDVRVRSWPLLQDSEKHKDLALGILVDENTLTLSLLTERDNVARQMQRFALDPLSASLADADILDTWHDEFERSDLMLGYLDIQRIVEGLLLPEQNLMGQELLAHFPEYQQHLEQFSSPVCRREYVDLAGGAPRLLFGMDDYRMESQRFVFGMRAILDIQHSEVASQLQRLPGFLPSYSNTVEDKILAYALGVDTDALVPALTELWTRLTQAEFACEELQDLQKMAANYHPVMLGMGVGMAPGLKGAGVALYDLEPDPDGTLGVTGSALVSFSTSNPQALAAVLASFVPGMDGLALPDDGTPVALPPFFVPDGTYAAIKGQHLVIYRGEAAQEAAELLGSEELTNNGISAFTLNPGKVTERMLNEPGLLAEFAQDDCATPMIAMLEMQRAASTMGYRTTFDELGWSGSVHWQMAKPTSIADLPGTYLLDRLGGGCAWERVGVELMRGDGTGLYQSAHRDLDCSLHETQYNWSRSGQRLIQNVLEERERDDCQDEWAPVEPEDFVCTIVPIEAGGFYCFQNEEGASELYRFAPQ